MCIMEDNKRFVYSEMKNIFSQVQMTAASHHRGVILLKHLYYRVNNESFYESLQRILSIVLRVDPKIKSSYVEKIMHFLAFLCSHLKPLEAADDTDEVTEHPLFMWILQYLLKVQCTTMSVVRYRATSLINKILDALTGNEISNHLCDQIETCMLERVNDSIVSIRLEAIKALHRLQDPQRADDPIVNCFLNFMTSDQSSKIRQLCVERIACRKNVIPQVLTRTRDVDVGVRLAAYNRLCKWAGNIKIVDRQLVLRSGFVDDSPKVRELITNKLIPQWLEYYEGDIIKFMKALRIDADEKDIEETTSVTELVLNVLFCNQKYNEIIKFVELADEKIMPFEKLNWETARYWRILVQHLRKQDDLEDNVSVVLPELIYFCKYIKNYCDVVLRNASPETKLEKQFILKQMLLIAKGYDVGDTNSRQCLNFVIKYLLEKHELNTDVIEMAVSNLDNTIPNTQSRIRFVSEIISEIVYPMNSEECEKFELERTFQISQLQVNINLLTDSLRHAVGMENYSEADKIKQELETVKLQLTELKNATKENEPVVKKSDIPTIIKYLDITAALLLSPSIKSTDSTIQSLIRDLIQEELINDNVVIRTKAMRCYALCCLIDKTTAKMGIHIFSAPIFSYTSGEECDCDTLKVCISSVVDLLRLYGSNLMAQPPEKEQVPDSQSEEQTRIFTGGSSLTELIQGFVDLLDDENTDIQQAACRGLCSLVFSNRVHSPSIISRLVLKWCNPISEPKLKQMIGDTLDYVAKTPNGAEQLEGAVLMTIKSLVYAPHGSPLFDVNVDDVIKFLLALCITSKDGVNIHSRLALSICSSIHNKPMMKANAVYCKILPSLEIAEDELTIKELLKCCDILRDVLKEKQSITYITKFKNNLWSKYKQIHPETDMENEAEKTKSETGKN